MLKLATFCFVVVLGTTNGHNGNTQNQNLRDADGLLQADLMPQELQSEYAGEAEGDISPALRQDLMKPEFLDLPYRPMLVPQPRIRRSAAVDVAVPDSTDSPTTSIAEQVKQYSRVIACFVLVVSAAIEVVVYIIEAYQVENV